MATLGKKSKTKAGRRTAKAPSEKHARTPQGTLRVLRAGRWPLRDRERSIPTGTNQRQAPPERQPYKSKRKIARRKGGRYKSKKRIRGVLRLAAENAARAQDDGGLIFSNQYCRECESDGGERRPPRNACRSRAHSSRVQDRTVAVTKGKAKSPG